MLAARTLPEGFNPAHIPGLTAWFKASTGVTLGGTPLATGTTPPVVTIAATDGAQPTASALRIEITTGGARGTALFKWSVNDGTTFEATGVATAATVVLASANITVTFPVGTYATDNVYRATVSQWNDRSPNARHAVQATAAKQPVMGIVSGPNSKPAIVFDATDDCLTISSFAWGSPYAELWIVARAPVASASEVLLECTSNYAGSAAFVSYTGTTGGLKWTTGEGAALTYDQAAISANTWYTFASAFDRTLATGEITSSRLNGVQAGAHIANVDNAGNFGTFVINIGSRANGGSLPSNATICEIVMFNAIVSADDRTRVDDYLRREYGHY